MLDYFVIFFDGIKMNGNARCDGNIPYPALFLFTRNQLRDTIRETFFDKIPMHETSAIKNAQI